MIATWIKIEFINFSHISQTVLIHEFKIFECIIIMSSFLLIQEVPGSHICKKPAKRTLNGLTFSQHVASVSSLMYITFQLFLPFSHFLTPVSIGR